MRKTSAYEIIYTKTFTINERTAEENLALAKSFDIVFYDSNDPLIIESVAEFCYRNLWDKAPKYATEFRAIGDKFQAKWETFGPSAN